ncbi:hypothetical protein [Nonomuraea sp. bgisy101]
MDQMTDVFQDSPRTTRQSLVERYSYKKQSGSSDTARQKDEIIT